MGFLKMTVHTDDGNEKVHSVVRSFEQGDVLYSITEFDGIRDIVHLYNPNKIVRITIDACDQGILDVMLEHGKITPDEFRDAMEQKVI